MPGAGRAEIYFISGMMFLILVLCVAAVFFFIKTYKKEMRERAQREAESGTEGKTSVVEQENVAP
jgi:uncharacterized protein YpmB